MAKVEIRPMDMPAFMQMVNRKVVERAVEDACDSLGEAIEDKNQELQRICEDTLDQAVAVALSLDELRPAIYN